MEYFLYHPPYNEEDGFYHAIYLYILGNAINDLVSTFGNSDLVCFTADTKLVNFLDLAFCLTKSVRNLYLVSIDTTSLFLKV